jgi:hypothetical protein
MSVISPYGKKWRQIRLLPTFEHELFFYFLLISPSYQLVHSLKHKKSHKGIALPSDFDVVRKTYEIVGDIYQATFEDWWQEGGYKIFTAEEKTNKFSITIDMAKSESIVLKEVTKIIKESFKANNEVGSGKIAFMKNKIHASSVNDRKVFIFTKAIANFQQGREVENWRIAVKGRLLSKWIEGLKFDSVPNSKNLKARTALGELTSKYMREALYLAENAARLNFPCIKPINTGLVFDFKKIAEILYRYKEFEDEMLERYKDQPEKLIRDQYLIGIKRQFRKKRRLEKAIDKSIEQKLTKSQMSD